MTPATPITEALEALMPEPHWAPGYNGPLPDGAFTADQMREAIRAATERAAKLCDEHANTLISVGFRGSETADECAAAIRASSGKGEA